jgi:hypothetical protein
LKDKRNSRGSDQDSIGMNLMKFSLAALTISCALACLPARSDPAQERPFDGFNIVVSPGHPFGSSSATVSLTNAKLLGARAAAIVPFLWQSSPSSPDLVRGQDMNDDELRAAVRTAHDVGLTVLIKPHVWIPGNWAGTVVMKSEQAWQKWFANYRREILRIAHVAAEEKADALAIGTELAKTIQRPEWNDLIGEVRGIYPGRLLYVAHGVEEAEKVAFWPKLDNVGVSLYPPLGTDCDRDGWGITMRDVADRLDTLAARTGKSIIIGEIGLRSAHGAAEKPWESPEERATTADPAIQAEVLSDWLAVLDRPTISGVLVWRWFTDPDAGGLEDTDFTVQGKPAEHVLKCDWTRSCDDSRVAAH